MKDLIERQAVIEINQSYHGQMPNEVNHSIWKEINELPSAQPEPCGDAVSRQYILNALAEYIEEYEELDKGEIHDLKWCAMGEAKMVVKEAPSAQTEPQWIPCSEWLPENDDAVLISHKHGVGKAWWNGRFWSSATKKCYKTVTAWMPLPEPYREEGD